MTAADPPRPRPAHELTEVDLVLRLARRWRQLGGPTPDGQGARADDRLSPHQERGLLALARLGRRRDAGQAEGVRVSHLAHHLGIAPRSATEVADALETLGLLARSPDPTDRRAVLLTLTAEGRQVVARARDRRRAAAQEALSVLDDQDRAELRRILLQLLPP